MSIYKHPKSGIYYVDVIVAGSKRVRRSTGTQDKVAAQEFHDKVKAQLWRSKHLGEQRQYTFEEAAVEFLKQHAHTRDYGSKVQHIKFWREQFSGCTLCSLTTESIRDALPTHKRSRYGQSKPLTGATKNRYLATLSKLLHDAVKRGWLPKMPYIEKYAESPLREEFMTQEQAAVFLQALPEGWMRDVCTFALATGMRAGEILSLEWAQVNPERALVSVLGSKAKSKSGRAVPLSEDAMQVITRRKGLHKKYVFARAGSQTREIDRRPFAKAVRAAGLPEGFRFHDLRHTWASWHAQAGTPMLTLQRLGGWKTLSMLNRYAHLSADDLAQYTGNVKLSPHPDRLSANQVTLRVVNG